MKQKIIILLRKFKLILYNIIIQIYTKLIKYNFFYIFFALTLLFIIIIIKKIGIKYFNIDLNKNIAYAEQKILKKIYKPYTLSILKYLRRNNADAKKVYNTRAILDNIITFLAIWYTAWKKERDQNKNK
jgi:hypothetical protein